MKGAYGALIKLFARNLFDIHHPMTASELADAHAAAGLEPLVVRYVLGLPVLLTEPPGGTNKYSTRSFAGYFSRQYLRLESTKWRVPGNRWTSPYAVCLARKPG